LKQTSDEKGELSDALAAGIFRGEGTTVCTIIGWRRKTPTPRLLSSVRMRDRNSIEIVAKFRRARKVFQPEVPGHRGRERQAL